MPENGAHFSGQGHLIEAVILGDVNKTVIPVVCDAQGRLIVDLAAGTSTIGNVQIVNTISGNTAAVDSTGDLQVDVNNFPATQAVTQGGPFQVSIIPDATTEFDYVTGSLTAPGSVVGIGSCKGIRVFAVGTDSRFSISGGSPITLRSNQIFYHIPQGQLLNPIIAWFSGSIDVWMEVEGIIPPTTADLGLLLGIAHI